MELRAIRIGRGVVGRTFVDNVDAVDKFSMKYGRDAEIYMGVAPRIRHDEGGGLSNCAMPTALWVDADDEHAARAELSLFDPEPSIIVRSGRGLHLYWPLRDAPPDMDQLKQVLRQLARRLEGDVKSAEPAHVLRVPGTMNHKYSPPRRVEIEKMDLSLLHTFNNVRDAVAPQSAAYIRARAWMRELPPAVEGEHGDDATYRMACMLVRDHGLDDEDALELMMEWNARCVPPWTEGELRKKIRGARAYGQNEPGIADPEVDFEGFEGFDNSDVETLSTMQKLTERFKVVNEGGKLRVLESVHDDVLHSERWERYTRRDFLEICQSVEQLGLVEAGRTAKGQIKMMPAGQYWLDHYRKKKTYSGTVFVPGIAAERTSDNRLNLWRGFAVKPEPHGWDCLSELIRETICRDEKTSYDYIIKWMARAVQKPGEVGGTAIVMKGFKGAGKGTFARSFVNLFGSHGMHVTSPEAIIGRFNGHLRDVVVVFADEAFWAGDKEGESRLKSIITEPTIAFESKGRDVVSGQNCIHLIVASNSEWIIPAGLYSERRFAVFECAEQKRKSEFWDKLKQQMKNGGMSGMLYDLLHIDIEDFNVFNIPTTSALVDQKLRTMNMEEQWLFELLNSEGDEWEWGDLTVTEIRDERPVITDDDLQYSLLKFYKDHGRTRAGIETVKWQVGRALNRIFRAAMQRTRPTIDGKRKWCYVLPKKSEALKIFAELLGAEPEELKMSDSDAYSDSFFSSK